MFARRSNSSSGAPSVPNSPASGRTKQNTRPKLRQALSLGILLAVTAISSASGQATALPPPIDEADRLALALRKLDRTARLLYITAHPDDENAGLIARLVHGEGTEVVLYTLTRGNGGQNEIGDELFDALAVLRSEELAAAHRFDGARQIYGDADDFGYSFSVEETFEKWGKERMLREVVEVVRAFEPDVILTLPPGGPGGGQHHQASAQLSMEAFHRAADVEYAPELGPPHRTTRLFQVLWQRAKGKNVCTVSLGDYDPILGCSYAEIGRRSREQHKCQGMARVTPPFDPAVAKLDWLLAADEEPRPLSHPFEGLEETLIGTPEGATPFGEKLLPLAIRARNQHSAIDPGRVASTLFQIRALIKEQPSNVRRDALLRRVNEAIRRSLGIGIALRAPRGFVTPGETLEWTVAVRNGQRHPIEIEWTLRGPGVEPSWTSWLVPEYERRAEISSVTIPTDTTPRLYAVPFPAGAAMLADTNPEDGFAPAPRAIPSSYWLDARLVTPSGKIPFAPVAGEAHRVDPAFPTVRTTPVQIVPDPSVRPEFENVVATYARPEDRDLPPPTATVHYLISTQKPGEVTVSFRASDPEWTVSPSSVVVSTPGEGREVRVSTTASGPKQPRRVTIRADAERGSQKSGQGYRTIDYPHIRRTALLVDAHVEVNAFECRNPTTTIGYIAGTGDQLRRAARELGTEVIALTAKELAEGDLSRFQTIVVGVRAYKVRPDLIAAQPQLNAWMRRGGHLVVQYQKFEFNDPDDPTRSPYVPAPG
ncbi:MAG: PIG-L deacetylase family protein, partial [Planctomycetota bacterium]